VIGFLREADAVIAAGEPAVSQRMTPSPGSRTAMQGHERQDQVSSSRWNYGRG